MARKYSEFTRYIFYSIIGAIIFLLIYSIWFNPEGVSNLYENAKEGISKILSSQSNDLIEINKCEGQYKEYSEIGEEKWDIDFNLITIEKINNLTGWKEFYNIYSFGGHIPTENPEVFPLILIATSVLYPGQGVSIPMVFECDHKGDLTEDSKRRLVN